jgi:hypothetical protein
MVPITRPATLGAPGSACGCCRGETVRQSRHGSGKVERVHGKRGRLSLEEAFEDSRQSAGLLILQNIISFGKGRTSTCVELKFGDQKRAVAIYMHGFEPCLERL